MLPFFTIAMKERSPQAIQNEQIETALRNQGYRTIADLLYKVRATGGGMTGASELGEIARELETLEEPPGRFDKRLRNALYDQSFLKAVFERYIEERRKKLRDGLRVNEGKVRKLEQILATLFPES